MNALFPMSSESTALLEEVFNFVFLVLLFLSVLSPLFLFNLSQETRQISSFRIFVEEGQDLPVDKNLYCVIYFGATTSGSPIAKTQVVWRCKTGGLDPFPSPSLLHLMWLSNLFFLPILKAPNWSEDFLIDDVPSSVNDITVGLLSKV